MPEQLQAILANLKSFGPRRLAIMGGVAALVAAVILIGSIYLNRPGYETLYVGLERSDDALAREWAGLDTLTGAAERPAERAAMVEALVARTNALCARIRAGDIDKDAVVAHVRRTVRDKLLVTNPGWLGEG